jgi:hypothetical protein
MNFMDTIKSLAPTVASALLGPLGGVAVTAIGSILGMSEPTQDKIAKVFSDGQIKPEDMAKIRQLEIEFKTHESEMGYKYQELEFKDKDSARNREIQTKDNTNKILAFTIVGSFIAMVASTLLGYAKVESVLAGTLVGYLSAKAEQVLAYYFGSSSGSVHKTTLLANSTPVK